MLVPVLNEEKSIGPLLEKIQNCEFVKEIVVIDGGSTDRTLDIVNKYQITLIKQKSRGKGGAILEFLDVYDPEKPVIMLDGDGTYDPADSAAFIPHLKKGVLVNGSRFLGKMDYGAMTPLNLFGNRLLNAIYRKNYHNEITDITSGMKAFYIQDLKTLNLSSHNFEIETEIMQKACRKLDIVEIPIHYYPRIGTSKLHPFRDGWTIFKRLMREKNR
jgi:dolichol-phosphate mannosyltransferase